MNSALTDVRAHQQPNVSYEEVAATARTDIQLFELNQLMTKLYHSDQAEPVCGALAKILKPMDQLGLIRLSSTSPALGQPVTVTRVCPPSVLLHFFWGDWLPAYYKKLGRQPCVSHSATPALCTVVLELPESQPSLADVLFELSLRLEVTGVAEVVHIESGDVATHSSHLDTEVKP